MAYAGLAVQRQRRKGNEFNTFCSCSTQARRAPKSRSTQASTMHYQVTCLLAGLQEVTRETRPIYSTHTAHRRARRNPKSRTCAQDAHRRVHRELEPCMETIHHTLFKLEHCMATIHHTPFKLEPCMATIYHTPFNDTEFDTCLDVLAGNPRCWAQNTCRIQMLRHFRIIMCD